MANLNQIMDYLADNQIGLKQYTGTTGTSLYNNLYYGDVNITDIDGTPLGAIITSTTENRAAFAQLTFETPRKLRVYCVAASKSFTAQVIYKKRGTS